MVSCWDEGQCPVWDCAQGWIWRNGWVLGAAWSLRTGWQGLAGARPGEPGGTHITGQLLVVLHELLVLLVDGQHLADAVGCCLGLARQRGWWSASQQWERLAHACANKVSSHPCSITWWKAAPKTLNSQDPYHPLYQPRLSPTEQVSTDGDLSG